MSNTNALSGLNISGLLTNNNTLSKVSEVAINNLHEDINNPRKEFDENNLEELAKSIEKVGVLSPLSVKPHPDLSGEYVINHGHRRLRASIIAGLTTVPAFLDADFTEAGQMLENIQRENLTPLDIGNWLLHTKSTNNLKNNELSAMLSKNDSWVSRHLALTSAPEAIQAALKDGLITSVESAVALAKAHKNHTDEVDAYISDCKDGEMTQKQVREFVKSLSDRKNGEITTDSFNVTSNDDNDSDDFDSDFDTPNLEDDKINDTDLSKPVKKPKAKTIKDDKQGANDDAQTSFNTGSSDSSNDFDGFDDDFDISPDLKDTDNVSITPTDSFDTNASEDSDINENNAIPTPFLNVRDIVSLLDAATLDVATCKRITERLDDNFDTYNESYDPIRAILNNQINLPEG